MNTELLVLINYRQFAFSRYSYELLPGGPCQQIDRGLGTIAYRMKVLQFDRYVKIHEVFPWSPGDEGQFMLANPLHLAVFTETLSKCPAEFPVFAIGEPRTHSKGLLIGGLSTGRNFARDVYLPSWVTDPFWMPRILDKDGIFQSNGFPPGVGFLVVAEQP